MCVHSPIYRIDSNVQEQVTYDENDCISDHMGKQSTGLDNHTGTRALLGSRGLGMPLRGPRPAAPPQYRQSRQRSCNPHSDQGCSVTHGQLIHTACGVEGSIGAGDLQPSKGTDKGRELTGKSSSCYRCSGLECVVGDCGDVRLTPLHVNK